MEHRRPPRSQRRDLGAFFIVLLLLLPASTPTMGKTKNGHCVLHGCWIKNAVSFTPVQHRQHIARPSYCNGSGNCCKYWVMGRDPLPIHIHDRLHPYSPDDPLVPLVVKQPPANQRTGMNVCFDCVAANRSAHAALCTSNEVPPPAPPAPSSKQPVHRLVQQPAQAATLGVTPSPVTAQQGAVAANVLLAARIINTSVAHGLVHKPRPALGDLSALQQQQQQYTSPVLPAGFASALSMEPLRQSQRRRLGTAASSVSGVDTPDTEMPTVGSTTSPPVATTTAPAPAPEEPPPQAPAPSATTGPAAPPFHTSFSGSVPSGAEVLYYAILSAFFPDTTYNASAPRIKGLSRADFYDRMAPLFTALTQGTGSQGKRMR